MKGSARGVDWRLAPLWLLVSACATGGITASPVESVRSSGGGEVSLVTRVGGGGRDESFLADCATDGSITVIGDTYGSFGDSYELLAFRLGPDRRLVWAKAIGRGNKEQVVRARRGADGGYLVLATSVSLMLNPLPTMGRPIPLAVKLSPTAVPEWSVLVGRTEQQAIYDLTDFAVTEDGGTVFVGGSVQAPGFKETEPALVKLDSHGQPAWSRRLPLGTPGMTEAIAALPGGDLVVAGALEHPEGPAGPKTGVLVVRIAPDGTPRWARKVSSTTHAMVAKHVVATRDGLVVLGPAGGGGALDIVALRFSGSGTLDWSRRYSDPETRSAKVLAMAVEGSGELILAGSTGAARDLSGMILLTGPDGVPRRSTTLRGDQSAKVTSVQPMGAGRLCVALTAEVSRGNSDVLTGIWTPPPVASASRLVTVPLEVRVSDLALRAEPLSYQHVPLPAGSLVERALALPTRAPASDAEAARTSP